MSVLGNVRIKIRWKRGKVVCHLHKDDDLVRDDDTDRGEE